MGALPRRVRPSPPRHGDAGEHLFIRKGKGAEDIFASLQLTDAHLADYTTVKGKFEDHLIPCTNIILERAKFNRRKQEANETVETFITDLH